MRPYENLKSASSSAASSPCYPMKTQPQKQRRNERERNRVNEVNKGFNKLRDRVPKPPGSKQKLSKVDTLREAANYIRMLQELLGETSFPSLGFPPTVQPSFPDCRMPMMYQHQQQFMPSPFYPHGANPYVKQETSPSSSFYSDNSFDESKGFQQMNS